MSGSVKPPSSGSRPHQPRPVGRPSPVRGKTRNSRAVEEAERDPHHTEIDPAPVFEPQHYGERDVHPHPASTQLTPSVESRDEEEEEFFDALDELPQDDIDLDKTKALTEAATVSRLSKGSRIERTFAALLAWVIERGKVRAIVSTRAGSLFQYSRNKLKEYRGFVRGPGKRPDKPDKKQARLSMRALERTAKEARKARNEEALGYLKLPLALRKIYSGKMARYDLHLAGLTLGDDPYSLSDVDIGITHVDLIEAPDGTITPEVTADIKGTLEIPLEGKPPLHLKLDMTGVKISLEGRLIPAANAWIGGFGPIQTVRELKKIKSAKGKLFSLKHVDIKARSIKVTLQNHDKETPAALVTKMESTRDKAIDLLFVSLGFPVAFKARELAIYTSDTVAKSDHPLVATKDLRIHYDPPSRPVKGDSDSTTKTLLGEFSVQAESIDVSATGLSDGLVHTIDQLRPEFMELMPGAEEPSREWLSHLKGQSSELTAHVEKPGLTLRRQVRHDNGKLSLTGKDHLKVVTGPIQVHNKGNAAVNLSASNMRFQGSLDSEEKTFAFSSDQCQIEAHLQQPLPGDMGKISINGHINTGQLSVTGCLDGDGDEISCRLTDTQLTTAQEPSRIRLKSIQVDLPENLEGSAKRIEIRTEKHEQNITADFQVHNIEAAGRGRIRLRTRKHQLALPVKGTLSSDGMQVSWEQKAEGSQGQTTSAVTVSPRNTTLTDLKLDHLSLGRAEWKTDRTMTGELLLENVEIAGDQLLSDALPVPAKYRNMIPDSILKGRKLHLSLKLPVTDGRIDLRKSEVLDFHLDHSQADNQGRIGSSTKYLLDTVTPYAEDCHIESVTVSKGRLWAAANIKGYRLWLPLVKVPRYEFEDEQIVHLPELLHGFTHAHFTGLSPVEEELLEKVQTGAPEAIHVLDAYCRTCGADKACQLLKMIDINPWISRCNASNSGEQPEALRKLTLLFRRYPETAGKSLAISLINKWPTTEEDLQFFCSASVKPWLDPVALSELLSQCGMDSKAYDIIHQASEQSRGSARFAYYSSVMAERMAKAVPVEQMTPEISKHYQQAIMCPLCKAASMGNPEALNELKIKARQKQPLAQLGLAGIRLAKDNTPNGFYLAMADLELLATGDEELYRRQARDILIRRARNAGKIFIHANIEADDILVRQQKAIQEGNKEQLNDKQLYLWGLRLLYGVQGIKPNRKEALHLLQQAKSRGVPQASVHIDVLEQLSA